MESIYRQRKSLQYSTKVLEIVLYPKIANMSLFWECKENLEFMITNLEVKFLPNLSIIVQKKTLI